MFRSVLGWFARRRAKARRRAELDRLREKYQDCEYEEIERIGRLMGLHYEEFHYLVIGEWPPTK